MSKIELDRNNKTLYGQIADILRERIMSGEFKPGDILPSERELAEEMQVSRIPVREAMKSLEYLGVVKQIRGKGVLVQTADLSNILKVVGPPSPPSLRKSCSIFLIFDWLLSPMALHRRPSWQPKQKLRRFKKF